MCILNPASRPYVSPERPVINTGGRRPVNLYFWTLVVVFGLGGYACRISLWPVNDASQYESEMDCMASRYAPALSASVLEIQFHWLQGIDHGV